MPRSLGRSAGWIVALVVLIAWMIVTLVSPWARRVTDRADAAVLRGLARLRIDWLMTLARGVDRLATGWTMFFVAIGLLLVTIVFRRWRHLFTFVGGVMVLVVIGSTLIDGFSVLVPTTSRSRDAGKVSLCHRRPSRSSRSLRSASST